VKFATECLGFSNVPEGDHPPPHHPSWKARVPRDNGSGYDFEDIRDHYLKVLFGVDATPLRAQDVRRYYALSRVVSGEVMSRTYAQWRAPSSGCGGALVWFARDLWPGAGWGLMDSDGHPKAALWYLKRAWASRSIHLTDEGLDGYAIHAINESAAVLDAVVEIELYKDGRTVAAARINTTVPARGAVTLQADALLGYFSDATNAYRFGPAKYDVVMARLRRADTNEPISEDFHFPDGMNLPVQREANVEAHVAGSGDGGRIDVTLCSDTFLQAVTISCDGYVPSDNYFHLAPGQRKRIEFAGSGPFKATLTALNWTDQALFGLPA